MQFSIWQALIGLLILWAILAFIDYRIDKYVNEARAEYIHNIKFPVNEEMKVKKVDYTLMSGAGQNIREEDV